MSRINLSAWREIINRIFAGFKVEQEVSPTWLVNPNTNRRLKLDYLYPQIGVAIWIEGGSPVKRRATLDEEAEQQVRDSARQEMCAAHNISLACLNLSVADYQPVFAALELALSKASIRFKRDETMASDEKEPILEKLSEARIRVSEYKHKVKSPRDLTLYGNLWQDQQHQPPTPSSNTPNDTSLPNLTPGMLIEHTHFGEGLITKSTPGGTDSLTTIAFEDGQERTFMTHLLAGKIAIVAE